MEKETLEPSLRFLTDAAHLLAQTAPETSAHIMAKRNAFMFENNLELSDRQREHICGSCGHIMVPGAGDALKLETDKAIRKRRSKKTTAVATKPDARKPGRVSGIRKVITCKMCDRYTKLNFPPPPAIPRRAKAKPSTAAAPGLPAAPGAKANAAQTSEPVKAPPSANASSKKRAKNRKQGLQALLQSQASSSAPKVGLGLSLSDFMKK
ncbi:RNAse P Rpr2/Rpp21/SNM1 subunit domain-containing protein [Apiospora saccharicola]|uniref:RNAse P Rpr2/Rpp21/SNM1 subunit domain-containing protein n=1 Tax=Apiospora saccharicola TaxID=335842 RepID=A0ABR1W3A5_9PEZI